MTLKIFTGCYSSPRHPPTDCDIDMDTTVDCDIDMDTTVDCDIDMDITDDCEIDMDTTVHCSGNLLTPLNTLQMTQTKTLLMNRRMKPTSIINVNTCFSLRSCNDDTCPSLFTWVNRLMPLYMYTIAMYVYAMSTIFSIDMYAFYAYCSDVYYDVCLALAIPGSAKSTLDLLVLAVIAAAISQQNKTATTTEFAGEWEEERGRREEINCTT